MKREERDPICAEHRGVEAVGFMSWPPIWSENFLTTSEGRASTWVCNRPTCQDDARDWVREITGHDGVFTTFEENRARRRGERESQLALPIEVAS